MLFVVLRNLYNLIIIGIEIDFYIHQADSTHALAEISTF